MQRCLKVFRQQYTDKWPEVLKIIEATPADTVLEHGTYTRPAEAIPNDGWGRGPITLLGDAAHPMRPTGALLLSSLCQAGRGSSHADSAPSTCFCSSAVPSQSRRTTSCAEVASGLK